VTKPRTAARCKLPAAARPGAPAWPIRGREVARARPTGGAAAGPSRRPRGRALDDPDLHCDFTTASTSTSASDIDQLCANPTDIDAQRACLSAAETVTDPDTGTGTYEQVEAWLLAAGAPYATAQLGIIQSLGSDATSSWDSSYAYLFPRDLLDFTNKATINGAAVSDCASPLTSTHPCGLTVGRYDLSLSSALSYGGINGHWKPTTRGPARSARPLHPQEIWRYERHARRLHGLDWLRGGAEICQLDHYHVEHGNERGFRLCDNMLHGHRSRPWS
jgi:hypothetical protein